MRLLYGSDKLHSLWRNPQPKMVMSEKAAECRKRLVQAMLDWEALFGVGPNITPIISEFDAAMLVGMNEGTYCADGQLRTAVTKSLDFTCDGVRYQVTANRPSGKPGSDPSWVGQKTEKKSHSGGTA